MRHVHQLGIASLTIFVITFSSATSMANSIDRPLREGFPGSRIGRGYRCPTCISPEYIPQALLIPMENILELSSDTPSLLFYLPPIKSEHKIVLGIKNIEGQTLYLADVQASDDSSGIARFSSPILSDLGSTEEESFIWHLSIICESEHQGKEMHARGLIRRSEQSNSITDLTITEPSVEQANQLYEAGLWSAALTSLDQLRRVDSENQAANRLWQTLLSEEGLELISSELPIEVTFNQITFRQNEPSSHL